MGLFETVIWVTGKLVFIFVVCNFEVILMILVVEVTVVYFRFEDFVE